MSTKGMGKAQLDVLRALEWHGYWSRSSVWWLWGRTAAETERLLASLVKRDLVTITEEPNRPRVYRPNRAFGP